MSNTPGPPASPVYLSNNQTASDNNGHSATDGREDMSSDDDEKVLQNEVCKYFVKSVITIGILALVCFWRSSQKMCKN